MEFSLYEPGVTAGEQLPPTIDQSKKVAFSKTDIADTFAGKGKNSLTMMANLIAPVGASGKREALPAGVTMFFCSEGNMTYMAERGMVVITSPLMVDGKLSYIAVDSRGVHLLQPKDEGQEGMNAFERLIRGKFNLVGKQSETAVNKEAGHYATWKDFTKDPDDQGNYPPAISFTDVADGDQAGEMIRLAIDQSRKMPFISTEDLKNN